MKSLSGQRPVILLSSLTFTLLLLLTACAPSGSPGASISVPTTVQTNCPAAGAARVAIMPPLKTGKQQNLVYIDNHKTEDVVDRSSLRRYDFTTRSKTTILSATTGIFSAALSPDGQWILFELAANNQYEIQLMRVDGQYRQTLSCPKEQAENLQFSPDQKTVAFVENGSADEMGIYSFNIATGGPVVYTNESSPVIFDWADNTHVYALISPPQSEQQPTLLSIDVTQANKTTEVDKPGTSCVNYAVNADRNQLFRTTCTYHRNAPLSGPSTISVKPVSGGSFQNIYTLADRAILAIRVTPAKTLLLYEWLSFNADQTNNGIWKINGDGSEPKLLTSTSQAQAAGFSYNGNPLPYVWSTVSRDDTRYAGFFTDQSNVTSLFTQTLDSEVSTPGASNEIETAAYAEGELAIVGWTTL